MKFKYALALSLTLLSLPFSASAATSWYCDYSWDGQPQPTQRILKLFKATNKSSKNESKTEFNQRFSYLYDIYATEQKIDWASVESIANYIFEKYEGSNPNKSYLVGYIDRTVTPEYAEIHAIEQFFTENGLNIIDDYTITIAAPNPAAGTTAPFALTRYVVNRETQKLQNVISSIVSGICTLKE